MQRWIRSLNTGWAIGVLVVMIVLGLANSARQLLLLEGDLVESLAIEDARRYAQALREFRTLYTSEVVERAMANGTQITHDYKKQPGALPLPATLSMLLGKRLSQSPGGDVRLYSDHPFPWRSTDDTFMDDFEKAALLKLRQDPDDPVMRFEEINGEMVVRYAIADRMRTSCVECHNTHPDSPKRDWNVGDVRGVLEIARPVAASAVATRHDLQSTIRRMVSIAGIAMIGLGLLVAALRRTVQHAQRLVEETEKTNLLLAQEIEQRQHAEDQALFAQKLESLGLLAGGIAHDFNNLLVGILGNAELATLKTSEDDDAHRHLLLIQQAGERAKGLIKQMLTYAGQHTLEKQAVNLTERIAAVTPLLITARGRNARLVFETDDDLPLFNADPAQLDQVLMNLVTNAADSIGDEPGVITIRTGMIEDDEGTVDGFKEQSTPGSDVPAGIFLEVEDTGCGLTDEARKRMFDPFFSTKGPGRGLGLAALQGIVRAHKGSILVASDEGNGTLFRIEFPLEPTSEPPQATSSSFTGQRADGLRVLVVDDDADARETVRSMLESHGVEIDTASSGYEAIECVQNAPFSFDAIVLDISMPGMSGLDTYQQLRQIESELHVLFISGFNADDEIHQLVRQEGVEFLQKPFGIEQIVHVVSTLGTLKPTE